MQQQIVLAIVLVVLFGTVCEARLTLEEANREGRALNLDPITEGMAYIKFRDEDECRKVIENWSDETVEPCIFRDHCKTSNALRVMTANEFCQIKSDDSSYNLNYLDYNSVHFEFTNFFADAEVNAVYPRVNGFQLAGGTAMSYTFCPAGHLCVFTSSDFPANHIWRMKFQQ